jgi:regulator of cell morphogenesis and NO signaling
MSSDTFMDNDIEHMLIRDIVDTYPAVMPVLAELGLDLCCGGGHPLGEALELHGLDRSAVLQMIQDSLIGAKDSLIV